MEFTIPKTETYEMGPNKTKTVRELGPVDISSIQQDVLTISEHDWDAHDQSKANKFSQLGRTRHILFKFVRDLDDPRSGYFLPVWEQWKSRLQPILETVASRYGYASGDFSRIMLARLPAGATIAKHIDPYGSSVYTHKIHVPIQTNPGVEFWVEEQTYHFLEGHAYEVNNKAVHGGINRGDEDRINLIIEYYET